MLNNLSAQTLKFASTVALSAVLLGTTFMNPSFAMEQDPPEFALKNLPRKAWTQILMDPTLSPEKHRGEFGEPFAYLIDNDLRSVSRDWQKLIDANTEQFIRGLLAGETIHMNCGGYSYPSTGWEFTYSNHPYRSSKTFNQWIAHWKTTLTESKTFVFKSDATCHIGYANQITAEGNIVSFNSEGNAVIFSTHHFPAKDRIGLKVRSEDGSFGYSTEDYNATRLRTQIHLATPGIVKGVPYPDDDMRDAYPHYPDPKTFTRRYMSLATAVFAMEQDIEQSPGGGARVATAAQSPDPLPLKGGKASSLPNFSVPGPVYHLPNGPAGGQECLVSVTISGLPKPKGASLPDLQNQRLSHLNHMPFEPMRCGPDRALDLGEFSHDIPTSKPAPTGNFFDSFFDSFFNPEPAPPVFVTRELPPSLTQSSDPIPPKVGQASSLPDFSVPGPVYHLLNGPPGGLQACFSLSLSVCPGAPSRTSLRGAIR